MKTRLLMLIVVLVGLSSFVVFAISLHYVQPSKTDENEADSISGFAVDDEFGNVRHYPVSELDRMPCEDFISIWDPVFLELNEADILNEKLTSCRAPLLEVVHANTSCSSFWRVELMEMKQDPKYDFLNDSIYQECSEVLKIKNLCEKNGDTWVREKLECVRDKENEDYELIELFKNTPEVKAFHMQYEDAQTSVREDHVSYFSGSEDGYLVRMNLYFDENYALVNTDFHCYYQKVHQFEFPQEDIASKIEKYDCKEYSEPKNEN